MKQDTVTISLIVIVIWFIGIAIGYIPEEPAMGRLQPVWLNALIVIASVAAFRLFFLCFQTLLHAAHHANPNNKSAIIIWHLILGPIISIPYYYLCMKYPLIETQAEQAVGGSRGDR